MNTIIKDFCNNYLQDKDKITFENLNDNYQTCEHFFNTLELTTIEYDTLLDFSDCFYQAMVMLYSILNWEYLPIKDDEDLKRAFKDKFSDCINNSYRIAERIINE